MHDFIKCLTAGVIAFIMQIKPRREAVGSLDDGRGQLFCDPRWETASVHTHVALKEFKGKIIAICCCFIVLNACECM